MSNIADGSGIYSITNTINGKIYIGSGADLRIRWKNHRNMLRRNAHDNIHLQRAWNKDGESAFVFAVIELVLPPFLLEREQYWLDKLKPWGDKGYNIARSAQAFHLGFKHTPEAIAKMRASHVGKPSNRIGTTHPPEAIAKMSAAAMGRKHTPETCAKIGAASKGKKRDPKTIEKMRVAATGQTHSIESRAKMSAAKSKTFIITAPDGTEHIVHGMRPFCKEHGLDQANLSRVARGEQKQYKGWRARYFSEEEAS